MRSGHNRRIWHELHELWSRMSNLLANGAGRWKIWNGQKKEEDKKEIYGTFGIYYPVASGNNWTYYSFNDITYNSAITRLCTG
jgi:hypothetical protein